MGASALCYVDTGNTGCKYDIHGTHNWGGEDLKAEVEASECGAVSCFMLYTKPYQRCGICDIREGACIQCAKSSCFSAFHPTCARKEKLMLPMKGGSTTDSGEPLLRAYCEKHLPVRAFLCSISSLTANLQREQAELRQAALVEPDEHGDQNSDMLANSNKFARAHSKAYVLGPPLVPAVILERVVQYIERMKLRKKHEFVSLVCRYWSLKREARRGAPLLKRLHLEPWTANQQGANDTEEHKIAKLGVRPS